MATPNQASEKPFLKVMLICTFAILVNFETAQGQEKPKAQFVPHEMVVAVGETSIKVGQQELARIHKGDLLWVFKLDEQQQWAQVKVPKGEKKGWVQLAQLVERQVPASAAAANADYNEKWVKGLALNADGKFAEARPLLLAALKRIEEVAPNGKQHAYTLFSLGKAHLDVDADTGIEYLRKSVDVFRELLGKTNNEHQIAIQKYKDALIAAGKTDEAIAFYEKLLGVNDAELDDAAIAMPAMISDLVNLYEKEEEGFARRRGGALYTRAETFLQKALTRSTEVNGRRHLSTLNVINARGRVLNRQLKFKHGENLLTEGLEILDKHAELFTAVEHQRQVAAFLNNLALNYERTGRLDKAGEMLRRSLELARKTYKKEHRNYMIATDNLAMFLDRTGANYQSQELLLEVLDLRTTLYGKEHWQTTRSLELLGNHYLQVSEFGTAVTYFSDCVRIREKVSGGQHWSTIQAMLRLSKAHRHLGNLETSERLFRRILERLESVSWQKQSLEAAARIHLQDVLLSREDFEAGTKLATETLRFCRDQLPAGRPERLGALNSLARMYLQSGRNSDAHPLLRQEVSRAEALHEKSNSFDSTFSLAAAMNNLGMNLAATGELKEALRFVSESEQLASRNKQDVSRQLLNKGLVTLANDRSAEAVQLIQQSREIERRYAAQVLPSLPQDAVDGYLATSFVPNLARSLSLAYHRPDDKLLARMSAGWLLNGKAIGQEAVAEGALITSPETTPKVRELRDIRSRLSQLSSSIQKDPDWRKEQLEQIAELEARQQMLTAEIARAGLGMSKDNPWVSIGQLRETLPFDAVMINIARIRINDFAANRNKYSWSADRYLAWVIPNLASEQEIKVVDLGEAAALDDAVSAVRKELQSSSTAIGSEGEVTAEASLLKPLESLSKALLEPLKKHLGENKQVMISPDGPLWLIPWEILRIDEKYLIEEYRVRYVLSGRQIVNRPEARAAVTAPAIFADPDFDSRPTTLSTEPKQEQRGSANLRSWVAGRGFGRLPGTANEAAAIRPSLEKYSGRPADTVTGTRASEARFRELSRPHVLVVSSHGFFMPHHSTEKGHADRPSNPLLRCGLALAGCNQKVSHDAMHDGILTGLEIVGTDLRGTELVVLSACETGVGDVRTGEGVAGLRQAFQLAGAATVVSTLWQIPDTETARLMNDFFGNLAEGMNKSEALRQAQLTRIKARRDRNGAAHPFFWAAFTLTGQE